MKKNGVDTNHLPLTDEVVKAVLLNRNATFDDMNAIHKSLCNSPKYGKDHELTIKTENIIVNFVRTIFGRR